jgi:hypothetical protein
MELRIAPARGLRTREAETRRGWLAAAALAVALVPSALGAPPPAARARGALPEPDPTRLALVPPDLLGDALGVGFAPVFDDAGAAPPVASPPPAPRPLFGPDLALAASVHEPSALGLAALSVASLAFASRGMRRSPRSRPGR